MREPRIYTDSALSPGQEVELDSQATQHVARALRMQPGSALRLFNGDGHDYPARLQHVSKNHVTAIPEDAEPGQTESPLCVHLGQVLSRGDRMDYAVQKSVELGVTEITPLTSERCEVRLKGDRAEKRRRHWQQIAISAAEQCGRATVPRVHPVCALGDWLQTLPTTDLRLVLHHRTPQSLTSFQKPGTLTLLIGPEGGLSEQEIQLAEAQGFNGVALGPRVLRTETAPVSALSVCQWLWGDFGNP